ncbi:MAG TPA: hypothetical protein DCO86_02790 [Spirochaetaceae bacterium]|nr:hypothetical protein [Spirochaetaceae bacterium]
MNVISLFGSWRAMMKRILFCILFAAVCVSSAYSGIFDGLLGGKKSGDAKSSSSQKGGVSKSDAKKLGVGIDGGIGAVRDGMWWSAGAAVRYELSDSLAAYGKLGYQSGDYKERDPFIMHLGASGAYLFEVAKDSGLKVGPGIGVSLLAPKPLGVSPEIGAVMDYSPSSMPISVIVKALYAPAFYFNVDANTSSDSVLGRFNFTVGLTYNFL